MKENTLKMIDSRSQIFNQTRNECFWIIFVKRYKTMEIILALLPREILRFFDTWNKVVITNNYNSNKIIIPNVLVYITHTLHNSNQARIIIPK